MTTKINHIWTATYDRISNWKHRVILFIFYICEGCAETNAMIATSFLSTGINCLHYVVDRIKPPLQEKHYSTWSALQAIHLHRYWIQLWNSIQKDSSMLLSSIPLQHFCFACVIDSMLPKTSLKQTKQVEARGHQIRDVWWKMHYSPPQFDDHQSCHQICVQLSLSLIHI